MSAPRVSEYPQSPSPAAGLHRADDTQTTMFTPAPKAHKTERDPVRTILVFAAVVAPLAIIPYMLVRGRLTGLRAEVADLRAANTKLAKEMKQLRVDMQGGLDETRRHVGVVAEREGSKVREALLQAERAAQERHDARRAWETEVQRSVSELRQESQAQRARYAEDMKELGQCLADRAASMQEVEMRLGWTPRPDDGRGIERTRRLARRLQETAAAMEAQASPQQERPPDEEAKSQ